MIGNTLKISDLKKDSKWCDKDRVMLYACFQLRRTLLRRKNRRRLRITITTPTIKNNGKSFRSSIVIGK